MSDTPIVFGELTDPREIAHARAQAERARRNGAWLEAHWPELRPHARGRFIAVAGQKAFIANTPEEAVRLAEDAHPDDGVLFQYVRPDDGPRIYAAGQ